jgi:hypothetical protein
LETCVRQEELQINPMKTSMPGNDLTGRVRLRRLTRGDVEIHYRVCGEGPAA